MSTILGFMRIGKGVDVAAKALSYGYFPPFPTGWIDSEHVTCWHLSGVTRVTATSHR